MRKYFWTLALCSATGLAVPGWAQDRSKSFFGFGRASRSTEKSDEKAESKSPKLKNYGELFGKNDATDTVSGDAPSPSSVQRMMDGAEQSRATPGDRAGRNSFDTPVSAGSGKLSATDSSRKVSLADEFDDSDMIEQQEELEEAAEEQAEHARTADLLQQTTSNDEQAQSAKQPNAASRGMTPAKKSLPKIDFAQDIAEEDSALDATILESDPPAWATDEPQHAQPPAEDEPEIPAPNPARRGSLSINRQSLGSRTASSRLAASPTEETGDQTASHGAQSKLQQPINTDLDAGEELLSHEQPAKRPVVRGIVPRSSGSNRLSISKSPKGAATTVSFATPSEVPVKELSSATITHATATQSPSVNVEWRPTGAVTVGQESACELVVRNTGAVTAQRVEIEATFPANVRMLSSDPQPSSNSALIWQFDEIAAGDQKVIQVKFIPIERGEVAAAASVRFTGAAATSFAVTEPLLALRVDGPKEVMVGDNASQTLIISNPGTGTAANVKVEAILPAGLEHSRGDRLTMNLGNLAPGENRPIRLALTAVSGGRQIVEVHATADNGLVQSAANEVAVIAPSLASAIEGPGLRYLNRQASYTLHVVNDGAADTDNVRVMHKVPPGFDFISADQGIQFDSQNRMLNWFVGRLGRGESTQAKVVLNPTQVGAHTHFIRATSDHGAVSDSEITTRVEGAASLVVDVSDLDDPVEVGAETAYEITVKNEGTASATNVALACELPAGVEFQSASGETSHAQDGVQLAFQPISQIAPGKSVTYRVKFKGTLSGNMRFRAKVSSDSLQEPLSAEELTKVYGE